MDPKKAPHTRNEQTRNKSTFGAHTLTTIERRRLEQDNQLPKLTNLPGSKDPWTRQEGLKPRQLEWANKPSWRYNTPLCRVGDRSNPSPREKNGPQGRQSIETFTFPPTSKENLI